MMKCIRLVSLMTLLGAGVLIQTQPFTALAAMKQHEAQTSEIRISEAQRTDAPLPSFPASCDALPLVGGEGYSVTKTASPPSLRIPLPVPVGPDVRSNWNTDWYIANPETYRTYMVILMPYSEMSYSIEMFLKYPNDASQKFYDEQNVQLTPNQPITIEVTPNQGNLLPYQINTNIGGLTSIGARYAVAVAGCR